MLLYFILKFAWVRDDGVYNPHPPTFRPVGKIDEPLKFPGCDASHANLPVRLQEPPQSERSLSPEQSDPDLIRGPPSIR